MSVYISFYNALSININNKRQINIIRQKLIKDLRRRISNPIKRIGSNYNTFTGEIEAFRIASIPSKKKHIKWLRKAKKLYWQSVWRAPRLVLKSLKVIN